MKPWPREYPCCRQCSQGWWRTRRHQGSVRDRYQCLDFSEINLHQFLQQDPIKLASFSTACWQQHNELQAAAHP